MLEAVTAEPVVSEPLTWAKICERYPDQWVVLVEIERPGEDHNARFRTARVAGAGKTRREAFEQGQPWKRGYPGCWNRFTGPITRPIADLLL
jgi:hypothetical protein